MSYRSILVPVAQPDHAASALEAAFLVARRFAGHVCALHVLPDLADPATHALMATRMSLEAATSDFRKFKGSAERELQRQAAELKRKFEAAAGRAGAPLQGGDDAIAGLAASWREATGFESELVARLGRIFDLTVIARGSSHDTVQAALLETGRPMLLTPPAAPDTLGDAVLLAWNASPQAARAAASALPFLQSAARVVVMSVGNGPEPAPTAEELRRGAGLARHRRRGPPHRAGVAPGPRHSPRRSQRRWPPTSWSSAPTRTVACGRWCSGA